MTDERENIGWQDIESAPKDGTFVDLWVPCYGDAYRVTDCLWLAPDENWWMSGRSGFVPYPPTHWRHVPDPPEDEFIAIPRMTE